MQEKRELNMYELKATCTNVGAVSSKRKIASELAKIQVGKETIESRSTTRRQINVFNVLM